MKMFIICTCQQILFWSPNEGGRWEMLWTVKICVARWAVIEYMIFIDIVIRGNFRDKESNFSAGSFYHMESGWVWAAVTFAHPLGRDENSIRGIEEGRTETWDNKWSQLTDKRCERAWGLQTCPLMSVDFTWGLLCRMHGYRGFHVGTS